MSVIFYTSAPGKAIITGQHSVLYGGKAVAVAISLRTIAKINSYKQSLPSLRFQFSIFNRIIQFQYNPHSFLIYKNSNSFQQFKIQYKKINLEASDQQISTHFKTADYCINNNKHPDSINGCYILTISSQIPLGQCLGSSAAFNLVLASSFQYIFKYSTTYKIDKNQILLNALRFQNVEHGVSSGLDVYVSFYGGFSTFSLNQTPKFKQLSMNQINKQFFTDIKLGLISTGLPKKTKDAVAIVRSLYQNSQTRIFVLHRQIGNVINKAGVK